MGHIHLGVLPNSKKWRAVTDALEAGTAFEDVLADAAVAVEKELRAAPNDPIFVETLVLLAGVPQAGRSENFAEALRLLDVPLRGQPSLLSLTTGLGKLLDLKSRELGARSDFGELSRRALMSALSQHLGAQLPGLFEATPQDLHASARHLAKSTSFAGLARSYFTRLLRETVRAYLDRALSLHVGPDGRFHGVAQRAQFDLVVDQYAMEATRIIKEFAGGWYDKTIHLEGRVDRASAQRFGAVAFKKIVEEMQRKRDVDA